MQSPPSFAVPEASSIRELTQSMLVQKTRSCAAVVEPNDLGVDDLCKDLSGSIGLLDTAMEHVGSLPADKQTEYIEAVWPTSGLALGNISVYLPFYRRILPCWWFLLASGGEFQLLSTYCASPCPRKPAYTIAGRQGTFFMSDCLPVCCRPPGYCLLSRIASCSWRKR